MEDWQTKYIVGLARAAVKLRKASDGGEGVELDADEVEALVDALKAFSGANAPESGSR